MEGLLEYTFLHIYFCFQAKNQVKRILSFEVPAMLCSINITWAKSKNTNISVLRICCVFASFRYLSDIFQQQIVVFHAVFQQKWTFRKSNFPSRCVFNQYRCYSASIRRMRIFIYTQISEINKSEC